MPSQATRRERLARSASSRQSAPIRTPSDRVTGRVVRVGLRMRSTAVSSSRLGLTVLGPSVIASSTDDAFVRDEAGVQPAARTRSPTSGMRSSRSMRARRRGRARRHALLSCSPSSGRPNAAQSALPATLA
jgi:hypothetical protein